MPSLKSTLFEYVPYVGISRRQILPAPSKVSNHSDPPIQVEQCGQAELALLSEKPTDDLCWALEDEISDGICITSRKCYPSSGFFYFDGLAEKGLFESEWNDFTMHIQNLSRWNGHEATRVKSNVGWLSFAAACTGILWIPLIRRYYLKRRLEQEYLNLYTREVRMLDGTWMTLNDIITEYDNSLFKHCDLKVRLFVPSKPSRGEGQYHRVTIIIHEIKLPPDSVLSSHDSSTTESQSSTTSISASSLSPTSPNIELTAKQIHKKPKAVRARFADELSTN